VGLAIIVLLARLLSRLCFVIAPVLAVLKPLVLLICLLRVDLACPKRHGDRDSSPTRSNHHDDDTQISNDHLSSSNGNHGRRLLRLTEHRLRHSHRGRRRQVAPADRGSNSPHLLRVTLSTRQQFRGSHRQLLLVASSTKMCRPREGPRNHHAGERAHRYRHGRPRQWQSQSVFYEDKLFLSCHHRGTPGLTTSLRDSVLRLIKASGTTITSLGG